MSEKKFEKKQTRIKKKLLVLFFALLPIPILIVFFLGKYFNDKPIQTQNDLVIEQDLFSYLIDFEDTRYIPNQTAITNTKSLSGSNSGILRKHKSYSPAVHISIPTNDTSEISNMNVRFWINPSTSIINASFIFSIFDQNGNQIHWEGHNVNGDNYQADNWFSFQHKFKFPKNLISTRNTIKIYLWNTDANGNEIYVDDISISLKENYVQESPRSKFIDFEEMTGPKISSKHSKSGFLSTFAKGADDFSASIKIPLKEIKYDNIHSIAYSFNILAKSNVVDAAFVLSITDTANNNLLWHSTHVNESNFETDVWQIANGNAIVPTEALDSTNTIKIYLWNRNDTEVYIDDVYIVIKEKDNENSEAEPAADLVRSDNYEKKVNHPPYDFVIANKLELKKTNLSELNKAFTISKKTFTGNFTRASNKDQILCIYKTQQTIISFDQDDIIYNIVEFNPSIPENADVFCDESQVFVSNNEAKTLTHYTYNSDTKVFEELGTIQNFDTHKIIATSFNIDKSITTISNIGQFANYSLNDKTYTKTNTYNLLNPEQGNVKYMKGNFFNSGQQITLFYLQNKTHKYIVLDYNKEYKKWELSKSHSNSSIQSYDKLEFLNDFYVCNFNSSEKDEVLQFNKTQRFDLKILGFNKMSYEILYNIDFKGFPGKQNPKFYEISKIITGDFTGDSKTEIIIFQDNMHKVEWLSQKVEMYYFE